MYYWHRYKFWFISAALHAAVIVMLLWHVTQSNIILSAVAYRPIVQAYVIHQPIDTNASLQHHNRQPGIITHSSQRADSSSHTNTTPSNQRPSIHNAQLKHILDKLSQLIAQHLPALHSDNLTTLVKVRFMLMPNGTIQAAHIIQSSGNITLDNALVHHIQALPVSTLRYLSQPLTHPIEVIAPVLL